MPEQLDEAGALPDLIDEAVAGEPAERWDVGLCERLAETIWKWLGREAGSLPQVGRESEGRRLRKAA